MSQFIPKKVLVEGMAANPLDKQVSDEQDVTKLAQEGILTAIAAETDAINQYTQISDLIFSSEQWLKDLAEPVINDIIAEEKKHLGQLTELLSQLPGYQKDFEEGEKETQTGEDTSREEDNSESEEKPEEEEKEEVEESGPIFDLASTLKILVEEHPGADKIWKEEEIKETVELINANDVDLILESLNIDPEKLDQIEKRIVSEALVNK